MPFINVKTNAAVPDEKETAINPLWDRQSLRSQENPKAGSW